MAAHSALRFLSQVTASPTGSSGSTECEFDLVHYITSSTPEFDGLVFKLKVYVVERDGGNLVYCARPGGKILVTDMSTAIDMCFGRRSSRRLSLAYSANHGGRNQLACILG